jgi:hypothetical protein
MPLVPKIYPEVVLRALIQNAKDIALLFKIAAD